MNSSEFEITRPRITVRRAANSASSVGVSGIRSWTRTARVGGAVLQRHAAPAREGVVLGDNGAERRLALRRHLNVAMAPVDERNRDVDMAAAQLVGHVGGA